jgi:hypothetical protein
MVTPTHLFLAITGGIKAFVEETTSLLASIKLEGS